MSDDNITAPRKLTDGETKNLRSVLKRELRLAESSDTNQEEDVSDMLDYTFAMIGNGKSVSYIIDELISMELEICDDVAAKRLGGKLCTYLKNLSPDPPAQVDGGGDDDYNQGGGDGGGGTYNNYQDGSGSREGGDGYRDDYNNNGYNDDGYRGGGDRGPPRGGSSDGGGAGRYYDDRRDSDYNDRGRGGGGSSGGMHQKVDQTKYNMQNLHVSRYGPSTTQKDLVDLFSPYVRVDEVVKKGDYAFINTTDPQGAQRAKIALNGTMVGGKPILINWNYATPNPNSQQMGGGPQQGGPHYAAGPSGGGGPDDDGARFAKLHVSGYGIVTTERDLIALFSPYVTVDEVVMKDGYCFVNTSDPDGAVRAKIALNGTMVGGQPIRINRKFDRPNAGGGRGFGGAGRGGGGRGFSDSYGGRGYSDGGSGRYSDRGGGYNDSATKRSRYDEDQDAYDGKRQRIDQYDDGGRGRDSGSGYDDYQSKSRRNDDDYNDRDSYRGGRGGVGGRGTGGRGGGGAPREERLSPNLHVTYYGYATQQNDLFDLFSQYVKIDEIVMKGGPGGYAFVNTSDPEGAKRAKDALNGTMVGGKPIRVNFNFRSEGVPGAGRGGGGGRGGGRGDYGGRGGGGRGDGGRGRGGYSGEDYDRRDFSDDRGGYNGPADQEG